MALPSAQLGGMPNMNFPGYVPVVQKRPNMWEQALASFLANAAGGVATGMTENALSREYDPNAPTGVKGFLSKVTSGPRETRQMHEAETQRGFTAGENAKTRKQSAEQFQTEQDRLANAEMNRRNEAIRAWTSQTQRDTAAKELGAMQTSADTARGIATEGRQGRVADAQIAAANAERVLREAQAKNLISEAEYRDFMGQLMRGEITQDPVTKKFVPTGNVQPAAPAPQQFTDFGYLGDVGRWLAGQWMGGPSDWAQEPPPTETTNIDPRLAEIMNEKYRKEHPAYQPYYMGIH